MCYFHRVDNVSPHAIQMLVHVGAVPFYLSNLDCLLMLYVTLVRHTLDSACEICNSSPCTDTNKLEGIQRNSAGPSFADFHRS
jgi:hypothetical protein